MTKNLSSSVQEALIAENGRALALHMKTPDVVTIEGSVLGGWNYLAKDKQALPRFAAALYDAGTKRHAKKELREALAARGASISFSGGTDRTYFSASCLPEDLPFTLSVVTECLREPLFADTEMELVRARALSNLKEMRTNCNAQAKMAFERMLYDASHVNYAETFDRREELLKEALQPQVTAYHKQFVGRGGLVVAIAGDIDPAKALREAEKSFSSLPIGTLAPSPKSFNNKLPQEEEKHVFVPKKTSIDVYLGASVPVRLEDDAYLPLMLVAELLGGGFVGHLMKTVRDRDGLTYGIYASVDDVAPDVDGCFRVWATFAPDLFDKGVATTREEVRKFFARELTEANLKAKQEEVVGGYMLGLSTTGGMARQLHAIGVRGKDTSYIEEYPDLVRSVTLPRLKSAAGLVPLDKLALAAAGTFQK